MYEIWICLVMIGSGNKMNVLALMKFLVSESGFRLFSGNEKSILGNLSASRIFGVSVHSVLYVFLNKSLFDLKIKERRFGQVFVKKRETRQAVGL